MAGIFNQKVERCRRIHLSCIRTNQSRHMKKRPFNQNKRDIMKNSSTQRIDQLTGLRFFAALLVFVSHLKWDSSPDFIRSIFANGYVGVSFFFVLSGFVLSYSYQDKIINGQITGKRYLFLRLARLSPLHFAIAIPFIGLAINSDQINLFALLANLSYMQSWVPISSVYFSFNAPSWSLSNEMFFYACFFFLVTMTLKRLINIGACLLILIFIAATMVTIYLDGSKFFGSNKTLAHWIFYIFPGFRIIEFICGMILFRLWVSGYKIKSYFVIPAYALLVVSMYFANFIPEAFRMSLYFLPVIVFFLFVHLQGEGVINGLLKSKFMVLLGNASFAFYLIHQPLIYIFTELLETFNLGNFYFFATTLTIITLLSIVIYLTYERWAERKLKEFAIKL